MARVGTGLNRLPHPRTRMNRYGDVNPVEEALILDKLLVKDFITEHTDITVPMTIQIVQSINDLDINSLPDKVVLKPRVGGCGNGVHLLVRDDNGIWCEMGNQVNIEDIVEFELRYAEEGLFFEEMIESHPHLKRLAWAGPFCDIRSFFVNDEFMFGNIRIPTEKSAGIANIALGAAVFYFNEKGVLRQNPYLKPYSHMLPDCRDVEGFKIPGAVKMLEQVSVIPPLFSGPLITVDGTIDEDERFILTELTRTPIVPRKTDFTPHGKKGWERHIEKAFVRENTVAGAWIDKD